MGNTPDPANGGYQNIGQLQTPYFGKRFGVGGDYGPVYSDSTTKNRYKSLSTPTGPPLNQHGVPLGVYNPLNGPGAFTEDYLQPGIRKSKYNPSGVYFTDDSIPMQRMNYEIEPLFGMYSVPRASTFLPKRV